MEDSANFAKKPSISLFQAMKMFNSSALAEFSARDLRPVIPSLVRMSLCSSMDASEEWTVIQKNLLRTLSDMEVVNGILALLSIDFHALEEDSRKEQHLRNKLSGNQSDSILISQLTQGLAIEFEQSDAERKLRLVLSEILFILSKVRESGSEFFYKPCELFEDPVYIEEVSDVLCIAHAELPDLLPITDLADVLMRVKNGAKVMCKLLTNHPESFVYVCRSIVLGARDEDPCCVINQKRCQFLNHLCLLNPHEKLSMLELCIKHKVLPVVIFNIVLHVSERQGGNHSSYDLVQFLTGLLLGNDHTVRIWISHFIKSPPKRTDAHDVIDRIRRQLLQKLKITVPDKGNDITPENVMVASSLVRVYCALKGMTGLKFSDEETFWLLHLLTTRMGDGAAASRCIQLSICMLLACPSLLLTNEQEKMAVSWIKDLMIKTDSGGHCQSYQDLLFLIAIHFHGNQKESIAELVSNTLGMKSALKANALTKIKDIFTKDIFTEQVIATHAAGVPVIPNLNANIPGYLSVHGVYHLLKNKTFLKYKVPIKDWIYRQICSVSSPLHPILPRLIETFIQTIISPSSRNEFTSTPISDEEVLAAFSASQNDDCAKIRWNDDKLLSQLLMIYYVLYYEDSRLANMKTIVAYKKQVKSYPEALIDQLPINRVVLTSQKHHLLTNELFASLLRLLTTHYPQLCLVEDWLDNTLFLSSHDADLRQSVFCQPPNVAQLSDALGGRADMSRVVQLLEVIVSMPDIEVVVYADAVVASLSPLLITGSPRRVLDLVKDIWFKIHSVVPRDLRLSTVNALRINTDGFKQFHVVTEKDLSLDPLQVLRCDSRVFRCPPILEIVLRILSAYLKTCRVHLANHIQENPVIEKIPGTSPDFEREELKNALITAQGSAVVQILIECCLSSDRDEELGMLNDLQEVRGLVSSHLHQMFIADPNLVKLIHFQGYNPAILPVTVAGIPSMHICLDFLPELISQPELEKRIFAIQLTSHLCGQYPLPKTMGVAKLCIDVMFTLLEVLPKSECATFLLATIPYLPLVCRIFPPLCEDACNLLTQTGRIAQSHLSISGLTHHHHYSDTDDVNETKTLTGAKWSIRKFQPYQQVYDIVLDTFKDITKDINKNIY